MIPDGIWWLFIGLFLLNLILGGIYYKFNTIEHLNKEYADCLAEGNTKQICAKLYKE